jgi:hypothetical protein
MGQQRRMLAGADLPLTIDRDIDMRTLTVWSAIVESFETMLETGNQTIRVVGPAPGGAHFIEVVSTKSRCGRRCTGFPATCWWSRSGSRCSPRGWSTSRCITCSSARCGG